MEGFHNCVKDVWDKPVPACKNPFVTLHINLSRTAKSVKIWSKNLLSHCKIVMAVCGEVIDQLERAQEARQLFEAKRSLLKVLRARLLGLAAIEKRRVRQKSRVAWLKKGMQTLSSSTSWPSEGLAVSQTQKHDVIFKHFKHHTRTYLPRAHCLNFAELGWEPRDLSLLDLPFTKDEIKRIYCECT
jgi:hypothetical protein